MRERGKDKSKPSIARIKVNTGNRYAAYSDDKLRDIFNQLLAHLRDGRGYDTFEGAAEQSVLNWRKDRTDIFDSLAIDEARQAGFKKLESIALGVATGKLKGSAAMTIFLMKVKMGYRDNVMISNDPNNPVSLPPSVINLIGVSPKQNDDS